jgi:hypothetical protein
MYLKFKFKNRDWRCGSSSKMPALQVWSPGFKPQTKKKVKLGPEEER